MTPIEDNREGLDHVPVMVEEVMALLRPDEGGVYWDLTVGAGGHLSAFLERAPEQSTRAFGLDGDPVALAHTAALGLPVTLLHGNLGELALAVGEAGWPRPRAVLLDLGLSSLQVDDATRGFSFRSDGPLDMRMDPTRGLPASEWLETIDQQTLGETIRELGEERFSGRIARSIKESLPITTTDELCKAVLRVVHGGRGRQHPARRTFQAIRIAVNQELEKAQAGLEAALELLEPGGRIAVISFHSGEDRVAKYTLRAAKQARTHRLLTKKPIQCSREEAQRNPRARSAKLRGAQKEGPKEERS